MSHSLYDPKSFVYSNLVLPTFVVIVDGSLTPLTSTEFVFIFTLSLLHVYYIPKLTLNLVYVINYVTLATRAKLLDDLSPSR